MIQAVHQKFARLLVNYCTEVQKGENTIILADTLAEPLIRALYQEVLKAGGIPHLRLEHPEMLEDLLEHAPDSYFESEPTLEFSEIKQIGPWIRVRAPKNTRALQNADKSKYSAYLKRRRPVQSYRVKNTRWVGTLYPTPALAQDAGMSLDAFEDFVYGAMFLYDDDPVAKWKELHDFQDKLITRLSKASEVHILGEGTDLKLSVEGRTWVNSDGHANMPSGEVFTGPVEDSAQGHIHYHIPSTVNGTEVADIRLEFKDGKVVKARAGKGNDLLQAQLETDEGARFLGELGIGTNYNIQQPTMQILYDEKIGGTVHLALGSSYEQTGGKNDSAIHWDMICDLRQGGAIYLDGELFQQDGAFKLSQ